MNQDLRETLPQNPYEKLSPKERNEALRSFFDPEKTPGPYNLAQDFVLPPKEATLEEVLEEPVRMAKLMERRTNQEALQRLLVKLTQLLALARHVSLSCKDYILEDFKVSYAYGMRGKKPFIWLPPEDSDSAGIFDEPEVAQEFERRAYLFKVKEKEKVYREQGELLKRMEEHSKAVLGEEYKPPKVPLNEILGRWKEELIARDGSEPQASEAPPLIQRK